MTKIWIRDGSHHLAGYSQFPYFGAGTVVREGEVRDIFPLDGTLFAEVHCHCCNAAAYFSPLDDLQRVATPLQNGAT